MYYAVYLEGPKWMDVLEVMHCEKKPDGSCARENLAVVGEVVRPQNYDAPRLHDEMVEIDDYMQKNADVSLAELEEIARRKRPGDSFYGRGAAVVDGVARSLGLR